MEDRGADAHPEGVGHEAAGVRGERLSYLDIAADLRAVVLEGRTEGDRLPSERALISRYGAARGTVRRALAELRAEGLVEADQRRGLFVGRRRPLLRFSRLLSGGGGPPAGQAVSDDEAGDVEVIEVGIAEARPPVPALLRLAAGAPVHQRRYRLLRDGVPVQVVVAHLAPALAEAASLLGPAVDPRETYTRLEKAGHRVHRFTGDVQARMPSLEEADALELRPGVPVLTLLQAAHTRDLVVEVRLVRLRADRYVVPFDTPMR